MKNQKTNYNLMEKSKHVVSIMYFIRRYNVTVSFSSIYRVKRSNKGRRKYAPVGSKKEAAHIVSFEILNDILNCYSIQINEEEHDLIVRELNSDFNLRIKTQKGNRGSKKNNFWSDSRIDKFIMKRDYRNSKIKNRAIRQAIIISTKTKLPERIKERAIEYYSGIVSLSNKK